MRRKPCGEGPYRDPAAAPGAAGELQALYLAGELLDVDAYTGGFNLQIAWATGYAAGSAAAAGVRAENWEEAE